LAIVLNHVAGVARDVVTLRVGREPKPDVVGGDVQHGVDLEHRLERVFHVTPDTRVVPPTPPTALRVHLTRSDLIAP
jgi:hypothetical protein